MAISIDSPSDPKTPYVADATLQPFLQPDFNPADFFNTTLPSLSHPSTATSLRNDGRSAPLSDLTSQLGILLSQLNAQTARLSQTLTQLTDEIVRSGGRLAYEVELLRGETLGLGDVLAGDLRQSIDILVPVSIKKESNGVEAKKIENGETLERDEPAHAEEIVEEPVDPEFLTRLRTLTTVRARLDAVVQIFGAAMQWPIAPSELATAQSTASIISVSAPASENPEIEAKAKRHAEEMRNEIMAMLAAGVEGLDSASTRLAELRALAEVWKGTAEEKVRLKAVEDLQKIVDEKARTLDSSRRSAGAPRPAPRIMDYRYGGGLDTSALMSGSTKVPGAVAKSATAGGYGFLQNLRDFKNEMYAD